MEKHRARKRFGQNFLQDSGVIFGILDAIGPQPNEHLLEIGPGMGALTEALLTRCKQLDVIEIDRDLVAHLKNRFSGASNLNIVCADALNIRLADFLAENGKLRIVGNLPYNISTPLLFHLLDQREAIRDMHFMLQKEVVERICAQPGSKAFGKLSIMLQFHCKTEKLFEVPPHCFLPAPKVSSAVIRLTPEASPKYSVNDMDTFKSLVAQAFSQRRKTLRNALKAYLSAEEIASVGVEPSARAETVEIAAFARLSDLYAGKRSRQDS